MEIKQGIVIESTKWEPIPDYGCLMTLEEFVEDVDCGCVIDYDGSGNYATKDKMSSKPAIPSVIGAGIVDKSFTHVVWFNR